MPHWVHLVRTFDLTVRKRQNARMVEPEHKRTAEAGNGDAASATGLIHLICGCMFAGKTTELLRILNDVPPEQLLTVKHCKDQRFCSATISTHDGKHHDAVTVRSSDEIFAHVGDRISVIAIDEGHFYDSDLPDVCRKLAEAGKRVIVTALDRDMWGLPFDTVERIRKLAGVVCVKRAVCANCGQPADRTYRKTAIVNRNLVGGAADFEPRCQACWSPPPEQHINSAEMA